MYKKIIFAIGLITTFFLLLNFIFSLILDKEDQTFMIDHRFNRVIVSKEEVKDKMVVDDSGFRNLNYRQKFINFKTFQVKCKRLDSFSIRNISFIKIDVEGKESGILNGMTKILKKDIIFLIEKNEPDFKRVKKIMKKNNFKPHVFDFKNKKFTEHNIEKETNIYFAKVNNSFLVSRIIRHFKPINVQAAAVCLA